MEFSDPPLVLNLLSFGGQQGSWMFLTCVLAYVFTSIGGTLTLDQACRPTAQSFFWAIPAMHLVPYNRTQIIHSKKNVMSKISSSQESDDTSINWVQ